MNIDVTVIPMGEVEDTLAILDGLCQGMTFRVVEPREPPTNGYSQERQQYLGKAFLDDIKALGYPRALAITHLDIYDPRYNYIFGLAETNGKVCVVSTARLKHPNKKIFHERLKKEMVHEIGHTLGLSHCRSPTCVMRFSNDIRDTDAKGTWFCQICMGKIEGSLLKISV